MNERAETPNPADAPPAVIQMLGSGRRRRYSPPYANGSGPIGQRDQNKRAARRRQRDSSAVALSSDAGAVRWICPAKFLATNSN
jgi:hypothetical protein